MSHHWTRSFCSIAVVFVVLTGWGCKKSNTGVAAADAGAASPRHRSDAPSQPAVPGRRVASLDQGKLSDEVEHINTALSHVHKLYQRAYQGGHVRDWSSYLQAKKMMQQIQAMQKHVVTKLRKKDPSLARQIQTVVTRTSKLLGSKSHPQRLGLLRYQLMLKTKSIDPSLQATLLTPYRATLKKLESSFVAYGQTGPYRVGITLEEPRAYYRWREIRFNDVKTLIKPDKRASHLLVVHVRDAATDAPLAGTDVSVEILDAKTKKQLSTHLLDPMWRGRPVFVHNLVLPKQAKNILVQISISAFPVNRTRHALHMLRKKGEIRFAASVQGGQLEFAKPNKKAKPQPVSKALLGADVMRAIAAVGGTFVETPVHRIGLALVPPDGVYQWKKGSLVWKKTRAYFNTQVVAFVQDKKSGLLVPNARIQFFYTWRTKTGKHEHQIYLKPVYDGFPSYRGLVRMKPINYDLKVRVDAPLSASFSHVRYPSYLKTIADFQPPLK